jgi:hypothetical protein
MLLVVVEDLTMEELGELAELVVEEMVVLLVEITLVVQELEALVQVAVEEVLFLVEHQMVVMVVLV